MRTVVLCACLVSSSPAAAQVAADTFNRVDSTDLGTTEVGARAYGEWSVPGSGPYADDVAAIDGNQLRVHGSNLSLTDPGFLPLRDLAFDVEVRVRARFDDDDYVAAQRANSMFFVLRSSLPAATGPVNNHGMIVLHLLGDGLYRLYSADAAATATVFHMSTIPAAVMAAIDVDGDGVLESGEPFALALGASGDRARLWIGGTLIADVTIPATAITGVDAMAARGVWLGRSRFFGVPDELEMVFDDLAIFEDRCPVDPDKLDPGACGCGVVETPGCGDAGPIDAPLDAAIDAPIAVDAAVDSPPTADASPPAVDDEGGGCCRGSRDTGPASGLLTLIVMLAMSARSRHSRRNHRR